MANRTRCAFCRSTGPFNQEHVIPEWLGKAIAESCPGGGVITRPGAGAGPMVEFVNTFGWKTNQICRECNGGWMKALEDEVLPVLRPLVTGDEWNRTRDAPVSLDAEAREMLARWAYKTYLVAELQLRKTEGLVVPRDEYWRFLGDRKPWQCQIWMGLYASIAVGWNGRSALAVRRFRFGVPVRTLAIGPPSSLAQLLAPRAAGYMATIQVGAVVFHLAGHLADSEYAHAPCQEGLLLPIWPDPDVEPTWPPMLAFDDATLETMPTRPAFGGIQVDPSLTVTAGDGTTIQEGSGEPVQIDPTAVRNRPKVRRTPNR